MTSAIVCSLISAFTIILHLFVTPTQGSVWPFYSYNMDNTLRSNRVVIVHFFVNNDYWSWQYNSIFEQASNLFNGYPQGEIVFGSVDCYQEPGLAFTYGLGYTPTIRAFRYGEVLDYSGPLTVQGIADDVYALLAYNNYYYRRTRANRKVSTLEEFKNWNITKMDYLEFKNRFNTTMDHSEVRNKTSLTIDSSNLSSSNETLNN